MQRITMVLLAVLSALALAVPVMAEDTFTIDGRTVSVSYHQVGDTLKVSGEVRGGEACRQLNVEIYFANTKESTIAHVEAALKGYRSSKSFHAATTVYADAKYKRGWHVSDVFLKCLN